MPERILLQSGDTELTPNEGYTAGSQSIQFGGVALRMACAEVRSLFLDHAAASLSAQRLSVALAAVRRGGAAAAFSALVLVLASLIWTSLGLPTPFGA